MLEAVLGSVVIAADLEVTGGSVMYSYSTLLLASGSGATDSSRHVRVHILRGFHLHVF